jgi:hypothetical protein
MVQGHLKHELLNIISGKVEVRYGKIIQTIARYLRNCAKTGTEIKDPKQVREQEKAHLEQYITDNNLLISEIDFTKYVSEGAEQKVYLKDSEHVLKLNDAIYYASWSDYFTNLLLHNYFFSDTAYELIGFTKENDKLFAVVQQSFVLSDQHTDISKVKAFLQLNGFTNTRNNDYLNHELCVILEDLHDENVLTQDGILYFIDTVFYLTDKFYQD